MAGLKNVMRLEIAVARREGTIQALDGFMGYFLKDFSDPRRHHENAIVIALSPPKTEDGNKIFLEAKAQFALGYHIADISESAIAISAALQAVPVKFAFNDVAMTVTAADTIESAVARYREGLEDRRPDNAAAVAAQQEKEAQLRKGWLLLNLLNWRDDDKVMEALGLMAGYDDLKLRAPVPFFEVRNRLADLGYRHIHEVPQNVKDAAMDENGRTHHHKVATAIFIAGNFMSRPNQFMVKDLVQRYFERFAATPGRPAAAQPDAAPGSSSSKLG